MAYVKISDVKEIIERYSEHCFLVNDAKGQDIADKIFDEVMKLPAADVCEVVRCKDCAYRRVPTRCSLWMGTTGGNKYFREHGDNFYCAFGTPKERGADKPKITCLNCKHLMFSDMYGECNKQLKIVNPSDTCEYAEPREKMEK